MRTVVDVIVFTVAAGLIVGGFWLLFSASSDAWQEWRR